MKKKNKQPLRQTEVSKLRIMREEQNLDAAFWLSECAIQIARLTAVIQYGQRDLVEDVAGQMEVPF